MGRVDGESPSRRIAIRRSFTHVVSCFSWLQLSPRICAANKDSNRESHGDGKPERASSLICTEHEETAGIDEPRMTRMARMQVSVQSVKSVVKNSVAKGPTTSELENHGCGGLDGSNRVCRGRTVIAWDAARACSAPTIIAPIPGKTAFPYAYAPSARRVEVNY